MIKARNIHKHFGNLHVLKGIDLDIRPGEAVSIVGPSGAGKTTLLHIAGTLLSPDPGGTLEIGGQPVAGLPRKKLAAFRNRHIGFIFQFHNLLPEFTALENVALPAYIAGESKASADRRAAQLLEMVGLADRLHHKPGQLSGGEQQRVAVARALINRPSVILADEPSGNLDSENAAKLHKLFFDLRRDYGQTFLIVTHNEELAAMSDRILYMRDGRITGEKSGGSAPSAPSPDGQ
ncbi:MAG: ABC transporter ATP-binding protein [Chlorobi bacterium]|nr:ABC transporter ATP-binding protein [Chlorobiota bacterium]